MMAAAHNIHKRQCAPIHARVTMRVAMSATLLTHVQALAHRHCYTNKRTHTCTCAHSCIVVYTHAGGQLDGCSIHIYVGAVTLT